MNKPLELTVYPRLKRPRYGYGIEPYREQWKREEKLKQAKRLTDAELAAEYWSLNYYGSGAQFNEASSGDPYFWEAHYDRANTLHRFATLPHYDEDQP